MPRDGKAVLSCCSALLRRLRIGYPRAARLMDMLEEQGIAGPAEGFVLRLSPKGQGSRAVLVGAEDAEAEQPPPQA